jgi:hypothetical protein
MASLGCGSEGTSAAGSIGDRCANDEDCHTGYCLDVGGTRICTEPCRRDRDCPSARNWWCAAPREIATPLCLCRATSRQACGDDLDRDCDGELDPCESSSQETTEEVDSASFPSATIDAGMLPPGLDAGRDAGTATTTGLDAARLDAGGHDAALDASSAIDAARNDASQVIPNVDASANIDASDPIPPDASNGFARLEDSVSVALGGPYESASYEGPASTLYTAATIYHPTTYRGDTKGARRPFAVVALVGEIISEQSDLLWLGPVLASHGFATVVLGVDPPTFADGRAMALEAALAMLKAENERVGSPVYAELDLGRAGLLGYGMGGGAVLQVLGTRGPQIQCGVVWEPVLGGATFTSIVTPTAILALNQDPIADSLNVWGFYASIPITTPKLYVERSGSDHLAPGAGGTASEHEAHAAWTLAFLKLHLESDTRYDALLASTGALVRYDRKP